MARIQIIIARHLCTAPRPQKEAEALAAAGHEVVIRGFWFDAEFAARDVALAANRPWRFEPVADARPQDPRRRLLWFRLRFQHWLARQSFRRRGTVGPDLFGYGDRLLARRSAADPAELSIFHSEGGLWAADRLRKRGRRVGVDFEDWFSRDLLPSQRRDRPVALLGALENRLVRRAGYAVTTSHALAAALAEAAGGVREPGVIYNAFPVKDCPVSRSLPEGSGDNAAEVALHWYSLVIGPGRGLETLTAALKNLEGSWVLNLRGAGDSAYIEHLRTLLGDNRNRLRIQPTVPNGELPARIAENDIGIASDLAEIPSRDLTVTNKVFQYLAAGLALVASATAGNREVLTAAPEAGALFAPGDARALAEILGRYLCNPARLRAAKIAARAAAERQFSFEAQMPRYAELAASALSKEPDTEEA